MLCPTFCATPCGHGASGHGKILRNGCIGKDSSDLGRSFQRTGPGKILNATVARDARGAAIESVYMHMVLQACQSGGRRLEMGDPPQVATRPECTTRAQDRVETQCTNVGRRLFARDFQTKVRHSARLPSTFEGEARTRPHHSSRSSAHTVQQNDVAKEIRGSPSSSSCCLFGCCAGHSAAGVWGRQSCRCPNVLICSSANGTSCTRKRRGMPFPAVHTGSGPPQLRRKRGWRVRKCALAKFQWLQE